MSEHVTKRQAEATLRAVKKQFAPWLSGLSEQDLPRLFEPGELRDGWVIAWESGPFEWTYRAFSGGVDDEMYHLAVGEVGPDKAREIATMPATPHPAGVWTEPINHWSIGIYRQD